MGRSVVSRSRGSLFRIGRLIERGDGTARILDAHLQLLLEDPWIDENVACRSLIGLMGGAVAPGRDLARKDVLGLLGVDRAQPVSIACSLGGAREEARHAREVVSTELWECLTATGARMPRSVASEKAHDFFAWVRERSALAVGIMEAGAPRDEAWLFFTLGRSVEQIDMTARLLATRALTGTGGASWSNILRAAGAHESYLRAHPGVAPGQHAAEYLLRDPLFPRSIAFALSRAEQGLRDLAPRADPAQRLLDRVRDLIEGRPTDEILADLPGRMAGVREAVRVAAEAISERYFPADTVPAGTVPANAVPAGTSEAS